MFKTTYGGQDAAVFAALQGAGGEFTIDYLRFNILGLEWNGAARREIKNKI